MSARASKPRRRTWRRDPAGRRVRILRAAAREFARKGVRDTRVEDVARRAGVAEGTVFHQFGSKHGLLLAVGDDYGRGLAEAAFGSLPATFHPRDAEKIVERIFRYVEERDGPLAVFLLSHDPAEGMPAQEANRARMLEAIEGGLEGWVRRGWIEPCDTKILAQLQFGLVETALRDCFLRAGGKGAARYVAETGRCLRATLGT